MLQEKEHVFYQRQLIIPEFTLENQYQLKSSTVLVIGAGGLAGGLLNYLAGMGIGKIIIVDSDIVDESNLQRQIIYNYSDIGKSKSKTAAAKMQKQNPYIVVEGMQSWFDASFDAEGSYKDVDLIIDACDNFETRYEIEQLALKLDIPWVHASIFEFEGQVSVFNGENKVQYSDIYPEPPSITPTSDGYKIGVMPSLPGVIGSLQAAEAFKLLTGLGKPLDGMLLLYDGLNSSFKKISLM